MIPNRKGTLKFATNNQSQTFALPPGGGSLLWLFNDGAAGTHIHAEVGDSNITVQEPTANIGGGFLVHPTANSIHAEITLRPEDTHIAVMTESGSADVYVTRGKIL
jgi:hypothetical protein